MKKLLALALIACMALTLAACAGAPASSAPAASGSTAPAASAPAVGSDANIGVFYYTYGDTYISTVRTSLDKELDALGVKYQDFDGAGVQTTQTEQVKTAISNGATALVVNIVETGSDDAASEIVEAAKAADIPLIFFNREVSNEVVNSYEKCAFVGTDAAEAGHMQGTMIAEYLLKDYDKYDLNGDGKISYVMFKGQEGNAEAEFRTQFSVEDADKALTEAGKEALAFYDAKNTDKYLVDKSGTWSAQASNEYMTTILSAYNEGSDTMIEMVICNNDGMAEGTVTALNTVGYNDGGEKVIPVFGVDATDAAKALIGEGKMAGTIKQDNDGMAAGIAALVKNVATGEEVMANTDSYNVDDDCAKIRIPYAIYAG